MHDDREDGFREPTEDERSARRVLGLAIALINARRPITSERLHREFYEELQDWAFRKAYQRDRLRLAASGIVVRRSKLPTGQTAWEIDESSSFVRENTLTPEDALTLDLLLSPLASDPSFPYANDLRLALTKINHSFKDTRSSTIPQEVRLRSRPVNLIEACMTHRHAARITYTRLDGSKTKRVVVPLGMFALHNTTYLVASKVVDQALEDPHVYNMTRMGSVSEIKGKTYPLPPDFDVRDYVRLPFQLGPIRYEADFHVSGERLADVRAHIATNGVWSVVGSDHIVRVPVSDEIVAVSWALAHGVTPLSPPSLVKAWRGCLESFCEVTQ